MQRARTSDGWHSNMNSSTITSLIRANPLRRTLRHGRQNIERRVERLGASLTGYLTWPIWTDARCLFVLSTGRTGTTTLARILDLPDPIDAHHEPPPELLEERKRARWEIGGNERKYRHIFARARGAPLLRTVWRRQLYAETSPRLTYFAPVIADLLPKAQFIFLHRDPVGVVRSGMKRGWYVDHPADYARVRPVEGERFFDQWETMSPFAKICWYWSACNEFALEFRTHADSSRVLEVRASELFCGAAVPRIFEFLDLPLPADEDVNGILEEKLNAQREGRFPKAERWTSSMWKTLQHIAGDTMEQLDYTTRENISS